MKIFLEMRSHQICGENEREKPLEGIFTLELTQESSRRLFRRTNI